MNIGSFNYDLRGNPKFSKKNLPHCHFMQTNSIYTFLGLNLALYSQRAVTPELWYGHGTYMSICVTNYLTYWNWLI